MKNQFYDWRKNKPKNVKSDGYFRVGEKVGYKYYDSVFNLKYLKATVVDILKSHNNQFEYKIEFEFRSELNSIWIKKNEIKKISKKLWDGFENLKYKIGQEVYTLHWRAAHEKAKVISARLSGMTNRIEYTIEALGRQFPVCEDDLMVNRIPVEVSKFKVGEIVSIRKPVYKSVPQDSNQIISVFSYDEDTNIYYKIIGDYNMVVSEGMLNKRKEPLVIVSEMDPFGEEDWSDD